MIIKGILRSVWDNGASSFDTDAELNTETGAVESLETIDGDAIEGLGFLTEETFRTNEKVYNVCMDCHQYILNDDDTCKGECDA